MIFFSYRKSGVAQIIKCKALNYRKTGIKLTLLLWYETIRLLQCGQWIT